MIDDEQLAEAPSRPAPAQAADRGRDAAASIPEAASIPDWNAWR